MWGFLPIRLEASKGWSIYWFFQGPAFAICHVKLYCFMSHKFFQTVFLVEDLLCEQFCVGLH